MTTGDDCGTNGTARAEWRPWIFVAAVSVVVVIVNATSNILEMQRAGRAFHWWEPVTWEVSSALIIVALAPLIGRLAATELVDGVELELLSAFRFDRDQVSRNAG